MRWFLAGLTFAALVVLAVGTASVRATNTLRRHECANRHARVRDHLVDYRRLEAELLDSATSRRLAAMHWRHLIREVERRRGRMQ